MYCIVPLAVVFDLVISTAIIVHLIDKPPRFTNWFDPTYISIVNFLKQSCIALNANIPIVKVKSYAP